MSVMTQHIFLPRRMPFLSFSGPWAAIVKVARGWVGLMELLYQLKSENYKLQHYKLKHMHAGMYFEVQS